MAMRVHHSQAVKGAAGSSWLRLGHLRLWHVLLIAFVLRMTLLLLTAPWNPDVVHDIILQSDAEGYHHLAEHLLTHGMFASDPVRTPLYISLIAGAYGIFGSHPVVVLLLQIFLDLGVCYLCYRMVTHLFGSTVGTFAALFYALDPTAILYTDTLMSDTLFTLLLVMGVGLLFRALRTGSFGKSVAYYASFSLCFALAALTRPVGLYLMLLVLVVPLWKERGDIRGLIVEDSCLLPDVCRGDSSVVLSQCCEIRSCRAFVVGCV